jgi:type III pantothenate kinase
MLLAIEQGNTNSMFAVHNGSKWVAQWRTATEPNRTADEYAVWLSQLLTMNGLNLAQLNACIISSVVPQSLFNLRNLSRRYLEAEPMIIGENVELGIPIRTAKPSEIGADRVVNALGAHVQYPGSLLVVDSGTATTLDVVAPDGGFEGGVIAPGIHMSVEALHASAAKLPRVALKRPALVIGNDTVSAMQSGVFWGYMSLIEGMIARIKAEYGKPMTVIATGGVAALFRDSTDLIDHFDPDVTIRGLLEIFRRNSAEGRAVPSA